MQPVGETAQPLHRGRAHGTDGVSLHVVQRNVLTSPDHLERQEVRQLPHPLDLVQTLQTRQGTRKRTFRASAGAAANTPLGQIVGGPTKRGRTAYASSASWVTDDGRLCRVLQRLRGHPQEGSEVVTRWLSAHRRAMHMARRRKGGIGGQPSSSAHTRQRVTRTSTPQCVGPSVDSILTPLRSAPLKPSRAC